MVGCEQIVKLLVKLSKLEMSNMSLLSQILWGTTLLSICALLHVSIVASSIPLIVKSSKTADKRFPKLKTMYLIALGFAIIVFAHTLQIWIWAFIFKEFGAFDDFVTSLYFALVTYTTLGYGDFVLGPEIRIFASFAAITGLLTFGLSTAFLVGLVSRILPQLGD